MFYWILRVHLYFISDCRASVGRLSSVSRTINARESSDSRAIVVRLSRDNRLKFILWLVLSPSYTIPDNEPDAYRIRKFSVRYCTVLFGFIRYLFVLHSVCYSVYSLRIRWRSVRIICPVANFEHVQNLKPYTHRTKCTVAIRSMRYLSVSLSLLVR